MATINLLPWREQRREELKKEYFIILGLFAAVAIITVFGWQFLLSSDITYQQDRNRFLEQRITELQEQVKEIQTLKEKKQALIERMKVIQALQGDRPAIVHIFDETVRTLPDGVFFTFMQRNGNTLHIKGTAESNNRVSSLMRSLDASEWFANPNLQVVVANKALGESANNFEMQVTITQPATLVEATEKNSSTDRKKK